MPAKRRLAVIEIGSNAVRLQVATVSGDQILTDVFTRIPLSLGASLSACESIPRKNLQKLVTVIKALDSLIRTLNVTRSQVIATAAIREAPNRLHVIDFVGRHCHRQIKVLSGDQEAKIVGAYVATRFADKKVLNVDVGGGSSDCALMIDGIVKEAKSFSLGTARMLRAAEKKEFKCWLMEHAKGALVSANGGSAMVLAAALPRPLLTEERLSQLAEKGTPLADLPSTPLSASAQASITIYRLMFAAGIRRIYPVQAGLAAAVINQLAQLPRP